jgi:hypothetical protein
MTVTVSAWFGVALVLSACFWLGVWARPRLATLRRRIGGSLGRAPASERGKAGTVERVRTYTECWTAGPRRAERGWAGAASRGGARLSALFRSAGSRGQTASRCGRGFERVDGAVERGQTREPMHRTELTPEIASRILKDLERAPLVPEAMIDRVSASDLSLSESLSRRELQVLELLSHGTTLAQAADSLGIGFETARKPQESGSLQAAREEHHARGRNRAPKGADPVSYPGDGLPRFKVGELEWFIAHGGDLDAYVYDRAYCCTIVGAFHSTSLAVALVAGGAHRGNPQPRYRAGGNARGRARGGLVATPLPLPDDNRLTQLVLRLAALPRQRAAAVPTVTLAARLRGRATRALPAGVQRPPNAHGS